MAIFQKYFSYTHQRLATFTPCFTDRFLRQKVFGGGNSRCVFLLTEEETSAANDANSAKK